MKMFVYTIYDIAAGVYLRPFFARSDDESIRSFARIAENKEDIVGQSPQDFTLHRIGTWDDKEGELVGETPKKVVTALEVLAASRAIKSGQEELFAHDETPRQPTQ